MESESKSTKCSRCRSKRTQETDVELNKYSTCLKCRNRRKIAKAPRCINVEQEIAKSGNGVDRDKLHFKYLDFLEYVKTNRYTDLTNVRLVEFTNAIPRYTAEEIDSQPNKDQFYLDMSKELIKVYIDPLSLITNFRFVIRDYHKGGLNIKKIAILFICSQDKTKQRKSRSKFKRVINNKLKIYECYSKVNLYYDLVSGKVVLNYTHKSHENCQESPRVMSPQIPSLVYESGPNIQDIAIAAVDNYQNIGNIDHRLIP